MKIAKEWIFKFTQISFTVSISELAGQVYLFNYYFLLFLRKMCSKSLGKTKVSIFIIIQQHGIVGKQRNFKIAFELLFELLIIILIAFKFSSLNDENLKAVLIL